MIEVNCKLCGHTFWLDDSKGIPKHAHCPYCLAAIGHLEFAEGSKV